MLDDLKGKMIERLRVHEKENKTLPARVIVYRDGVSEARQVISIRNPNF
jgi:hypothetical protein